MASRSFLPLIVPLAWIAPAWAYDFQYFLPQEFLKDLPLRDGSFASEVIHYVLTASFPDVHHKEVESGWFSEAFADSDFNSESYRSRRDVCVRVAPGGNPQGEPHMCEHPNSHAPQAVILPPANKEDIGRFHLEAEFEFSVPGHLDIESRTCFIVCWHDTICDEEVTITGVLLVSSSVRVQKAQGGTLHLLPTTEVSWKSGPDVKGCHPDWLVKLFADVKSDLSDGVRKIVESYVSQNLQSELAVPQTMSLHPPDLNLTYELQTLQFVHSTTPANESYVIAHANCVIHARARNGSIQAFPDASAPWTGKHNALPLDDQWRRVVGSGPDQLVLLGGARFSQELLTMLARSMHYVGMLYSQNSTHVKDAELYSTIDMSCPEVDISKARVGVIMKQDHLHFQIDCLDKMAVNASNFSLVNFTFSQVMEELFVSAYVPNDHTAGIILQVLNVSMGSANLTAFQSHAFIGSESELKSLALQAMQKSLPLMNDQLNRTPIIFCGGGSSSCALVPFAPHPSVTTVPPKKTKPGYVQLAWYCQCGSSDFYQSCVGFPCPEAALGSRFQVRQLRQKAGAVGTAWVGPRKAQQLPSTDPVSTSARVWASMFSNPRCSFIPGQSMAFANVPEEQCMASDQPALAPAFKLHSYEHGWHLYTGCNADDCSSCGLTRWVPVRRCTCLEPFGTCIVLASSSDECVGGLQSYPDDEPILAANNSRTAFMDAIRVHGCKPCGVEGDLKCDASWSGEELRGDLFCDNCSTEVCALKNISLGQHQVPQTPLGQRSGYNEVALATPRTLTLLRACAQGAGGEDRLDDLNAGLLENFLIALALFGIALVICWSCGFLEKHCWWQRFPRLRLWARLCHRDRLEEEKHFHWCLWMGCALLTTCGLVWMRFNPLAGQLAQIENTMDTSNFDTAAAIRIVETARARGFWVFVMCAAVLFAVSLLRLLQHVRLRVGLRPPKIDEESPCSSAWRFMVVFLLTEAGAAASFLAFVFWQGEFSTSFERQKQHASDLGFLSGVVASSTSAVFCMRVILSWIGPMTITLSLSTSSILFSASLCKVKGRANRSLNSVVLGIVLTQEVTALILAIAYFHSGYASTILLWLIMCSGTLSGVWFYLLSSDSIFVQTWLQLLLGCLVTSHIILKCLVGLLLTDSALLPFLLCSSCTTVGLSSMAVILLGRLGAASPATTPRSETSSTTSSTDHRGHMIRADCVSVLMLSSRFLLEKEEAKTPGFGARIKWRRLCALLGCLGLLVGLQRSLWHNFTHSAWDDLNALIASWIGSDALIDHDSGSVLAPCVQQYDSARTARAACSVAGAVFFTLAVLSDVVGSSVAMRWPQHSAVRFLKCSRMLGFLGSICYACGMLVLNLLDYVGLLDFGVLEHCGSGFCKAVTDSMKSAVGSGLLAKAGMEFLPLLVCLAWTFFRIGFFLASDPQNMEAVNALMWVTLSCMLRLSPVAGTAAFVASPSAEVIGWFIAFLLLPTLLLGVIVKMKFTSLAWYFLWGWVLYLMPLLVMASYALGVDFGTLLRRLFEYLKQDWPSFLAEFTLSDVLISDLFFTMVFVEKA